MMTFVHHDNDFSKRFKIVALCGAQWKFSKERDDFIQESISISNDVHQRFVSFSRGIIWLDITASQEIFNLLQNFTACEVLADVKLGDCLPTEFQIGTLLECHMETAFTIDKTGDV